VAAGLPNIGLDFCDEEHRADLYGFFKDRSAKFPGGPRVLDQVAETIDLCIASKRLHQPSLVAFLEAWHEP
jgi:alanyl aminopeptidase